MKENFHQQTHKGRESVNTLLYVHFYVIQLGFMETHEHKLVTTLKHQ
jgi:hypothetical protein